MKSRANVLVEGHQGAGLSNYHGDYPYTSSRDCLAAAMLSELGVAPTWPMRVILAVKVFPTRNHPGRLYQELSASEAETLGIAEYGGGSWGVADRRRRVGIFQFEALVRAARLNGATEVALTGADYLDREVRGATRMRQLSDVILRFVDRIESATGLRVRYISTGPETDAMVDTLRDGKISADGENREPTLPGLVH